VFSTYRGAREIKERWEWFEDMMACVVCNKLQLGVSMESKLCNVKKMDGRTMGSGLAQCLALSLTSQTAVDEWIFRYPALQELEKEADWFRATMDTVAQRLLSEVGWGAKLRLYVRRARARRRLLARERSERARKRLLARERARRRLLARKRT
jgi:hypothetical protein